MKDKYIYIIYKKPEEDYDQILEDLKIVKINLNGDVENDTRRIIEG